MRERLRTLGLLFATSFRASPGLTLFGFVFIPLSQVVGQLVAVWLKVVADAAVTGDVRRAVIGAGLLAATGFAQYGAGYLGMMVRMTLTERVGHALERRLSELASGVPGIEHFERPEYLDRMQLLRESSPRLGQLMNSTLHALNQVAMLGFACVLLASVHPLLLVLPAFGVPAFVSAGAAKRRLRRVEDETAEPNRLSTALYELGVAAGPGKELRVFNLADELSRRWRRAFSDVARPQTRVQWSTFGWGGAAGAVSGVGFVLGVAFAVRLASQGRATAGDVLMTVAVAAQVGALVQYTIQMFGFMLSMLRTAGRLHWLIDYARPSLAAGVAAPERLEHGIELRDVSFTYPGTDTPVLQDGDLTIPAGSVVAVVGENGAGKTSLVKLLCRFYEPTAGQILVDGADLAAIDAVQWRTRVAAGFQDFVRFELVAGEVVGVGDLDHLDDRGAIAAAISRAGATDVEARLEHGLATQLGREWEGGVELSSGQWQKLALARAFMRESPLLLVLDEPTSALDAATEHALFERFAEAARRSTNGGITILVSHRFSTVRMADHIVVIDAGRIVEHGSHDALVRRGGLYAELYELQARAYRS